MQTQSSYFLQEKSGKYPSLCAYNESVHYNNHIPQLILDSVVGDLDN